MGLTKAQIAEKRAREEALEHEAELAAFRRTECVSPDVKPSDTFSAYSTGWAYNAYSMVVSEAWSTSVTNGTFYNGLKTGGSRGKRWLFSSKTLALMAMRYELELEAAKKLRRLDKMIEAERDLEAMK